MPYIKVDLQKISEYSSTVQSIQNRVNRIRSDFSSVGNSVDWDVKSSSNIQRRLSAISSELNAEKSSLNKMVNHLSNAKNQYSQLDTKNQMKTQSDVGVATPASKLTVTFNSPFKYVDTKSLLKDTIKTGGTIYSAFKAGFFKSGFDIKQVGDYIRIYGQRKPRAAFSAPQGNRVKVGSDAYYSKGYALWYKDASLADKLKSSFSGFGKDTFGLVNSAGKFNVGAAIGYAGIAYDTITNIVGNVKSGASTAKIAADATTDVAKGLGSMAVTAAGVKIGAAIGSFIPIPGVGTLVGGVIGGAVAGFAYNYIVDGGLQIGGKSIAGWVSTGLETAYNAVGDAVKSGAQAVANVAKTVANTVSTAAKETVKAVSNVAKSVGNAVSSAAKSVKNFFGKLFG